MKILFIHRVLDGQFLKLHNFLNANNLAESYVLCGSRQASLHQGMTSNIYTFDESFIEENSTYYYSGTYETGSRISEAITQAMRNLLKYTSFDVIVYHSTMWSVHLLRDVNIPKVQYLEFLSYEHFGWKPEYPPMYEQRQSDVSMEALSYLNILNSEVTIVPSKHVYNSIPDALKNKIIIQADGFHIPENISDTSIKKSKSVKFRVGFFARNLDSSKGFDQFCKIMDRILHTREGKNYEFIIVGDENAGYCYDSLHLKGKTLKEVLFDKYSFSEYNSNIAFHNTLPYADYISLIQSVDVCMYPIYSGSLCWGLLEMMSCGKPVIGSDRVFVPEVIQDGENGYLCEYDNISDYCEKLEYLRNNPKILQDMWKQAKTTIREKFHIEHMAKEYLEIFQKLIS